MLSRLFRRLLLTARTEAVDAGQLQFGGELRGLADPEVLADHLRPVRQTEWVVYAKPPFAGPDQVLDYVGRYTHRIAISNQRLLDVREGEVRFRYTDYRVTGAARQKTMSLVATEFIRRVLLHVLPPGFHRMRHYGLLANRRRRNTLATCRHLLGTPPPALDEASTTADDRDRYAALTGGSLRDCPRCGDGHMQRVQSTPRPWARPPLVDTS